MKIGKALACSLLLWMISFLPAIAQVTVTHTGSRTNEFTSGSTLATLDFSSLPDSNNTVVFFIYCWDGPSGAASATFAGEGMTTFVTDRVVLGYLDDPSSLSGNIVLNAPVGTSLELAYWGLAQGVDTANLKTAVGTTISGGVQSNAALSALSVGDIVYSCFTVNNFGGAAYSGGLASYDGSSAGFDGIITTDTIPSDGDYSATTGIDPSATETPGGISIAFTEAPAGIELIAAQDFETPGSGIPFSFDGEDTDISDGTAWGERSDLSGGSPSVAFTSFQGANYVYGQRTESSTKSITLGPIDVSSCTNVSVRLSLAANSGVWESNEADDLVVRLDKDNNGSFETTLVDFSVAYENLSAGRVLGTAFQDLRFSLPEDSTVVNLRIEFTTTGDLYETVGIDDIRIMGTAQSAGTVFSFR